MNMKFLALGIWRIICLPFWVIAFFWSFRGRGRRTHGSARWARRWEQLWYGAIRGEGVILGQGAFGRLIRFSTDGLVMVFAATGAGKGLGVVIPSLLTYRGSMVVTDPKGENYAITRRQRSLYGNVRMLNPSDVDHSDRFNPMDIIRIGTPSAVDDAAALASLMVVPEGEHGHWDTKAISILKAFILHVLEEPPASRTLAKVRTLSVGSAEVLIDTLQDIADNSTSVAAREIASGAMNSFIKKDGSFSDEFGSILSNLQKATEPWSKGSPGGRLSSSSTFSLADLSAEVTTLYFCVDEDLLEVYGRWLRVMVGCTLKSLTRVKGRRPTRKVVLLLDEVAVLGRLDVLEAQAGLLRAYCTPVLIWQSMPQIHKVYGEAAAKALLANATARVFFGVNDNDTAQYVATMIGNTTTLSNSSGVTKSGQGTESRQQGQSESGYWLLDASEVQRSLKRTIVMLRDVPYPILGRRIDYRYVWRWLLMWDPWNGKPVQGMNSEPKPPQENDGTEDTDMPDLPVPPRQRGGYDARAR